MNTTILKQIYDRQYKGMSGSSGVTSSHWKKFDLYQVSEKSDGDYILEGSGFGDFEQATLLNRIKRYVPMKLSQKLFAENNGELSFLKAGELIAKKTNRVLNYDSIRQILSVQTTFKFLKSEVKTICVIGDGYGFSASLFKELLPQGQIILVNLGRTLFFDAYFISKAFPESRSLLLQSSTDYDPKADFIFIEAENYHLIQELNIDVFFNCASFQEMDPSVIQNYFEYIYASKAIKKYFYCCNRIEKKLPDGTITRIDDYPWKGKILFNEVCPWYIAYPASTPPFWRKFDGVIKHIMNLHE